MSATQTAVDFKGPAFAGQLADEGENDILSYLSEDASNEIPFGTLVVQGTVVNGAKLPAAQADVTANKVIGLLAHSHAYAKDNEVGDNGVKDGVQMNVMRSGRMWVYTPEAVTTSDAVRVRGDTNAGAAGSATLGPGTFLKSASAGHTVLMTKGARWMSATSGAGYAVLQFDLDVLTVTND